MGKLGFQFLGASMANVAALDANLLVLRVTALTDLSLLQRFKRVSQYTVEDALLLEWIVEQFSTAVTTSYVLAEASNLGNSLTGRVRDAWFTNLASYAVLTEERHVAARLVGSCGEAVRFGVTDAALTNLSDDVTIITSERPLAGYLRDRKKNVLNFFDVKLAARQRLT